ncbi:MAG: class I SAM-dependent methyltransferase [Acetobacteraceae bacterium]
MRIPAEWPAARFDLVVLSEVLYFLSPPDIAAVAAHVHETLVPGGVVLLVNWRGGTDDPCSGDAAAETFIGGTRDWLSAGTQVAERRYRLDLLRRC